MESLKIRNRPNAQEPLLHNCSIFRDLLIPIDGGAIAQQNTRSQRSVGPLLRNTSQGRSTHLGKTRTRTTLLAGSHRASAEAGPNTTITQKEA